MGTLHHFHDLKRRAQSPTYFSRTELNQLLSLYSRRVASGEWRDYAIDQQAGMAVFSVYRHTHDRPLFSIAKRRSPSGRNREFVVFSGWERLTRATTMNEALTVFDREPTLVTVG